MRNAWIFLIWMTCTWSNPPDLWIRLPQHPRHFPGFSRVCSASNQCTFSPTNLSIEVQFQCWNKRQCICKRDQSQDRVNVNGNNNTAGWDVTWSPNRVCLSGKNGPCGTDDGLKVVCKSDSELECIQSKCRDPREFHHGYLNDQCQDDNDCQKGLLCQAIKGGSENYIEDNTANGVCEMRCKDDNSVEELEIITTSTTIEEEMVETSTAEAFKTTQMQVITPKWMNPNYTPKPKIRRVNGLPEDSIWRQCENEKSICPDRRFDSLDIKKWYFTWGGKNCTIANGNHCGQYSKLKVECETGAECVKERCKYGFHSVPFVLRCHKENLECEQGLVCDMINGNGGVTFFWGRK